MIFIHSLPCSRSWGMLCAVCRSGAWRETWEMGLYPRLTPWRNWKEWCQVKNGIFSQNIEEQIWALEVIKMWRARGKTPHSVDTCGNLLEVILNDSQPSLSGYSCRYQRSESELKIMYAMCIVRAVNGLVEPSQQGYYAESVMSIATKIGLPPWFVDLRHDSTHNTLPTINLLRSAARSLLMWYRDTYWEQQHIYIENLSYRCLHYEPCDNSREVVENSNQFDVLFARESTFLANILLPLFHEEIKNAIHTVDQSDQKPSSKLGIDSLRNYKREMWELLLFKTLLSHKGAIHMILTSIFATAVNDLRTGSHNASLYYSVLNWWTRYIYERYLELEDGNDLPAQKPPSPLLCIWEIYRCLTSTEQSYLMPMRDVLERLYNISSLNGAPTTVSSDEECQEKKLSSVAKRILDDGCDVVHHQKRRRMWPLGNKIGELSSNYLHLLEELPN